MDQNSSYILPDVIRFKRGMIHREFGLNYFRFGLGCNQAEMEGHAKSDKF